MSRVFLLVWLCAGGAATPPTPPLPGPRPVCTRVGTRSEGWAWPDGRFIRWAKCKDHTPVCTPTGKDGEGWYDGDTFIAAARCG